MIVRPWRRTGTRTVHRDRWVHLRAEAWTTGGGAVLDPWYMLDWPEIVHVVALTPDDRMVLVRQFRPGAGATVLELPGGMMEPHETDPATAQRLDHGEEVAVEVLPVATVLAGLAEGIIGNASHAGGILLALRAAGRIGF